MTTNYYPAECTPTVHNPTDPRADAELLRASLNGIATDGQAIIDLLTDRTNIQRIRIAHEFKTMYRTDLIRCFKSQLGGHFESTVVALMTPLPEYYAKEIYSATCDPGIDYPMIEVFASLSNWGIKTVSATYENLYGDNLEDYLKSKRTGHFGRLLVSLYSANRNEDSNVDEAGAIEDAKRLLAADAEKWRPDESTFNSILITRSYSQLRRISEEYRKLTGRTIYEKIKREVSGDLQEGFLAIVQCAFEKCAYFAERLHEAITGMGATDSTLIRIIVTRSEIDLGDIKDTYKQVYRNSLAADIADRDRTSGDYKKLLIALVSH